MFQGKFLGALGRADRLGELPRDPVRTDAARQQRMAELKRHDWVVYAKTPLAGPEMVLDYLSRYTHRVAVSNERIVGIDAKGVRLRVRADDHGGKRTVHIDGPSFVGRFMQHVLPPGFKRIRHYGPLSPALRAERLAQARAALDLPAPKAQACEDAAQFLKRVSGIDVSCCPHCRLGHWRTVQLLPPLREAPAPHRPACRAPP
ncbi:MAG TPA: transposase [Candidatus Krumholzibacteria bacterium]|nr:transposase [Candidatus Krumholzibacteria bacterium]